MKNLLCFLILSTYFLETMGRTCFPRTKYIVHVVNKIRPDAGPMYAHCASGHKELGNHTLYYNDDFNWSLCEGFLHRTLFFCRITWGSKSVSFDVYRSSDRGECLTDVCYWEARLDGIYFSGDFPPTFPFKKYSW
ncbi:hypothetical protein ABFS83_07G060600 [Erythranthe nasuta]